MKRIPVGRLNNKEVEISFDGEEVSSDGGLLLIDKIDKELNLIDKIAKNLLDTKDQEKNNTSAQRHNQTKSLFNNF